MIQQRIRETAKELLAKKAVDVVIGFGEGSLPLRATPIFARTSEEADHLIWNSFCDNNLATYLHKFNRFKVGIVVKGCDARSVIALALEKRFQPGQVVLIGVPCQRMVDRKKVKKAVKGEILRAREEGETILVEGDGFKKTLKREEFLYSSCKACTHRNPHHTAIRVGDPVEESALTEAYPDAREFEKMTPGDRWAFFEKETERCIRCYACREACPMCYCAECFVDNANPKWIEKGLSPTDLQFYHLVRAYHQTGRCTACGACERACPMDISLGYLTQKLNQEVEDLFDFKTGVDDKATAPLSTYKVEDKQEFIK
jgi:formate dehydrogenase subunit beta